VSTVAVDLAHQVFGKLDGKSVLVVGAGKMSRLAARHLHASGVTHLVVTNRSPERADALAAEIDGIAKPWADLDKLLVDADIVIASTGAREPVLTRALFKKVMKARKWRPVTIIDITVPRNAEPAIGELDGVYLYDIDDLDKVVRGNLAERMKAAEHASKIVEHEAVQLEQWLRTQGVVPTIRALREHFARVADGEVQKALDQLARKDLTADQQRELLRRVVQLVVNKLLHVPTTVLRGSNPDEGALRAAILCELFGLAPAELTGEALAEPATETQVDDPAAIEEKARA
jgi:glutamyl-tRNA reductase